MVGVRKLLSLVLLVALVTAGLGAWAPAAQAADTGNPAPQTSKVVSDEPGRNTPSILDGTVYSIAQVGNNIVVGGQFTQVNNGSGTPTFTRIGVLAFNASTGKILPNFAPDPLGIVYKVLPAADGKSVYVAGSFGSAAGQSMPGRLFKIDVTTGAVDPNFTAPTVSGDIRDLELVGNHLFLAGKFTHINGVAQKALGTVYADTGKRDPYFNSTIAGVRNNLAGAVTNILQISVNPQNNRLMAVGNFTSVDGQSRSQIARFDIGNVPSGTDSTVHPSLTTWSTTLYTSACAERFDTYMTDVEYSRDGTYFVVSTTGAYGGASASNAGTSGCDVVARFEDNQTATSPPTWTAYTGSDSTWTVEVTDNVIYAGGHQRFQNNPSANNVAGPGSVSREGIAALNPVNGMPFSWNPTRARGVGVQDMLATSDGLYVGSDTELLGHTAGNTYHPRIAVLPLATGTKLPVLQTNTLPVTLYRVASGASQLTRRSFTGTTAGTAANVTPAGSAPAWSSSTGAFIVNGVLYTVSSTDGSLARRSFDGTTYGAAAPVTSSDALVVQADWHTDAKTITSIFYAGGFIYYTKSGTNALYRRAFEVEDGVVGQQRFSTTTAAINWTNVRGAFVVGNKLYFANTSGNLSSATWNQSTHNISGAVTQLSSAAVGTGWSSRAMFPYQAVPSALNEAPLANASISCDKLACTFDGTTSTDPENGALSYDWDFGDGTSHGTGATATHSYAAAGDRPVTLVVTDDKGATSSVTRTASPTDTSDKITFVGSRNNNGSRSNHTITAPTGTQVGDTLLLFFAGNSTTPVYAGPSGWTPVASEGGSSFDGLLFTKTATLSDIGPSITVTSRSATDGTPYTVKSDLTVAAYRGVGTPAIKVSDSTSQSFASTGHQTPTVDAPDGASWLVSFWSDKSSTADGTPTNWNGPTSQTQRSESTASGSNHMSSLLMDSNKRVGKGVQGGLNGTASVSAQALTMSVLLSGTGSAPANQNPVAHATLTGCTDLTCTFDGESSSDPEQGALNYDWNWGDGTSHGNTATASHTFSSGGAKTVTLTVSDPLLATGTDTVVGNPVDPPANTAPTAAITSTTCTHLTCSPNASTSSDPQNDALTYDWSWGDGTPHDTTANPTHVYTSAGDRLVTLTVSDGHLTDNETATLTTTNAGPTATITDPTCANLSCTFTGSTSGDPDGDTLSYSWDFGDGGSSTATSPTHNYASPGGTKTVVLTVSDGHGLSDTDSVTVSPSPGANAVPTARITGVNCVDLTCSFVGDTSDDPENDTLTYSWEFGDGGTSTEQNPTHPYGTQGARTVTLTVDDGNGNQDTDTAPANPTDPVVNPASNVTFVGTASNVGNSTARVVTLPPGVHVGDTMLLFIGSASNGRTYTDPTGWTLLEAKDGTNAAMGVRAWTKKATMSDTTGTAKVTVNISSATKADLTVAVYRGTDATTAIDASASKIDNASGAAHTSPAVTATKSTDWLVTYWADRSNTSTAWTAPLGVAVRWIGQPDSSSAHALGLLADSNAAVTAGPQGQLTATANGDSSRGASVSVLLNSN
jgi:PKD repeat protein